jgi:hypothetical protein
MPITHCTLSSHVGENERKYFDIRWTLRRLAMSALGIPHCSKLPNGQGSVSDVFTGTKVSLPESGLSLRPSNPVLWAYFVEKLLLI